MEEILKAELTSTLKIPLTQLDVSITEVFRLHIRRA